MFVTLMAPAPSSLSGDGGRESRTCREPQDRVGTGGRLVFCHYGGQQLSFIPPQSNMSFLSRQQVQLLQDCRWAVPRGSLFAFHSSMFGENTHLSYFFFFKAPKCQVLLLQRLDDRQSVSLAAHRNHTYRDTVRHG